MVGERRPGMPVPPQGPGAWPPRQPYQHQAEHQYVGRATPARPRRRADASRWHWLLFIPIVLPLLPPLYNRMEPRLLGLPFFYWCQLAFAGVAALTVAIVHVATKERR
jgi:hypothetical protein